MCVLQLRFYKCAVNMCINLSEGDMTLKLQKITQGLYMRISTQT